MALRDVHAYPLSALENKRMCRSLTLEIMPLHLVQLTCSCAARARRVLVSLSLPAVRLDGVFDGRKPEVGNTISMLARSARGKSPCESIVLSFDDVLSTHREVRVVVRKCHARLSHSKSMSAHVKVAFQ